MIQDSFSSLELCAGAGGQALGLEQAGFEHTGLVEIEHHCCDTLRQNRPEWEVFEKDLRDFVKDDAERFKGVELLAGGLPCPPFSVAGKQLGDRDERNLFPAALDLAEITRPRAVMIENVRGILSAVFEDYRQQLKSRLEKMGYRVQWRLVNASDFGVPQLRPRVVIVALQEDIADHFTWPSGTGRSPGTVGDAIYDLITECGWRGASVWKDLANDIAPTIVGGSRKHGGPDLGPTRAKKAWATLGVDAMGIADEPPAPDFSGMPRLTVPMVARLQGFPDEWEFLGRKTASYRQVGNAFPPPVARAVAEKLYECLATRSSVPVTKVGLMDGGAFISEARRGFHAALLRSLLRTDAKGIPSNADRHSRPSIRIAVGIIERMGKRAVGARLAGQMAGSQFEEICKEYLAQVFPRLSHLRPGRWVVEKGLGGRSAIAQFDQYEHLASLEALSKVNPELAAALGSDYLIKPDVVVIRFPEEDAAINTSDVLVDQTQALLTPLRKVNRGGPILHASVSCKWTLRSDRAQNARSEALNLVRNRKGRLPHIVVVTGEPTPSRIASIALGTGDVDCVYHFALPELVETVRSLDYVDGEEMLNTMINGKRLRDIADLPLDLAI